MMCNKLCIWLTQVRKVAVIIVIIIIIINIIISNI
jgi:hypothetical protein